MLAVCAAPLLLANTRAELRTLQPVDEQPSEVLNVAYVLDGETAAQLATRLGMSERRLRSLNRWGKDQKLFNGERVTFATAIGKAGAPPPNAVSLEAIDADRDALQWALDALTCQGVTEVGLQKLNITRIGSQTADGGYLLSDLVLRASIAPQDTGERCLVYGFGINTEYHFENFAKTQLRCDTHGYDPTVNMTDDKLFDFHKLGLWGTSTELEGVGPVTTYEHIARATNPTGRRVAIFKCDIEGSEWAALQAMSDHALQSIDQLALELHWFDEQLGLMNNTDKVNNVLKRIDAHFAVVHTHINNACGMRTVPHGLQFPNCWELTFINRQVLQQLGVELGKPKVSATNVHEQSQLRPDQRDEMNVPSHWAGHDDLPDISCECHRDQPAKCSFEPVFAEAEDRSLQPLAEGEEYMYTGFHPVYKDVPRVHLEASGLGDRMLHWWAVATMALASNIKVVIPVAAKRENSLEHESMWNASAIASQFVVPAPIRFVDEDASGLVTPGNLTVQLTEACPFHTATHLRCGVPAPTRPLVSAWASAATAAAFKPRAPPIVPGNYMALHMRMGDCPMSDAISRLNGTAAQMAEYPPRRLVLVTDDAASKAAYESVLKTRLSAWTVLPTSAVSGDTVEGAGHDYNLMWHASSIISISRRGWSSFSYAAGVQRNAPVLFLPDLLGTRWEHRPRMAELFSDGDGADGGERSVQGNVDALAADECAEDVVTRWCQLPLADDLNPLCPR